jgi:hypothetical protein
VSAWQSQRRQSLSRAGGLVVIPKRIGVGFYPGQTHKGHRDMLRQHTTETCTCTRHDTAPARTEQVRTAGIRSATKRTPSQNTRAAQRATPRLHRAPTRAYFCRASRRAESPLHQSAATRLSQLETSTRPIALRVTKGTVRMSVVLKNRHSRQAPKPICGLRPQCEGLRHHETFAKGVTCEVTVAWCYGFRGLSLNAAALPSRHHKTIESELPRRCA